MGGCYKIQEFAELAGVTVRALHHYDRLGLLRPGRTESGYRVYVERDLETVEQIVALKFLGVPLKQIGVVLKRAAQLPDALRLQRRALEEKHGLLGRAIRAIRAAEESLESGGPADAAILRKIIEVIDMQDGIAVMKKYYSEEAWEKHKRHYEEGPSPEWREFYRDAEALLGSDPGAPAAQSLIERWTGLSRRAHSGDPAAVTDSPEAWIDREHWPPVMQQRLAEFKVEEVHDFIRLAKLSAAKPTFSEETWASIMSLHRMSNAEHSRLWQARVDLFCDIEKNLGEDPAGDAAQALVARWKAQTVEISGGKAELIATRQHNWAHRKHWPESLRWEIERVHMMSWERFEKAADFLDRAVAAGVTETKTEDKAMINTETLLADFVREMSNTRRMLERVPEGKFGWKPHEKSWTLGKLANHVANLPAAVPVIVSGTGQKPEEVASKAELLAKFDERIEAGRAALAATNDEHLSKAIRVTPAETKERLAALRGFVLNHQIHHRGQLSVYLRMLGVAVPGMYGPSADEQP